MAAEMLEKEKEVKKKEREATLSERVPPLQMSGLSIQDLQVCASHSHIIIKQRGSNAQNKTNPLMYIDASMSCLYVGGVLEDMQGPQHDIIREKTLHVMAAHRKLTSD